LIDKDSDPQPQRRTNRKLTKKEGERKKAERKGEAALSTSALLASLQGE